MSAAPAVTPLFEIAPAKINLTLRIVGRRADDYHALESLVAFADIADELTLEPGEAASIDVMGPFAAASGRPENNLVFKAARALNLPSGHFTLNKCLPVGGGLGGGSADAAAALRLIARRNGLAANDARLMAAARATGADVPVCLELKARLMSGAGETLGSPLALPRFSAVLANPGVMVSTRDVFAAFAAGESDHGSDQDVPLDAEALVAWLAGRSNDLAPAAIGLAPEIADVTAALVAQPGCRLARMSGSGATCFALFRSDGEAVSAAQRLGAKHGNWWICPTSLG